MSVAAPEVEVTLVRTERYEVRLQSGEVVDKPAGKVYRQSKHLITWAGRLGREYFVLYEGIVLPPCKLQFSAPYGKHLGPYRLVAEEGKWYIEFFQEKE